MSQAESDEEEEEEEWGMTERESERGLAVDGHGTTVFIIVYEDTHDEEKVGRELSR